MVASGIFRRMTSRLFTPRWIGIAAVAGQGIRTGLFQRRADINTRSTYQSMSATEANNSSAAAT